MEFIIDTFKSLFNILLSTDILGMPLLVWGIIPTVLGLLISFLKGKKE